MSRRKLFIAGFVMASAVSAALSPVLFRAHRADATHPPAGVIITVGTPEPVDEPGIPAGKLRFRVPLTLVNPAGAVGSEAYIFTTSTSTPSPFGGLIAGGNFIRAAGFPAGFTTQIITYFPPEGDPSDSTMYVRNVAGGLGAGTHNVGVIVDYPGCGTPVFNVNAELYENPGWDHLTARGDRYGWITTPCDDCPNSTLTLEPVGAAPAEVLIDQESTLTWHVSLTNAPADRTAFFIVLPDPPANLDGGTFVMSSITEFDETNPTNPRAKANVTVKWSEPGTKTVQLGVDAVFTTVGGSTCRRFLLSPLPVAAFVLEKPKVVLDVFDSDGKKLERPATGNRQAWVVVDDDDDNYNGMPDKDETVGQVEGEDDYVEMLLHKVDPPMPGAVYTLSFPTGKLKVWVRRPDGGLGPFTPDVTMLDANQDVRFAVEGIALSGAVADVPISVKLTPVGGHPQPTGEVVDFTVYQVAGALSVAGLTQYPYHGTRPVDPEKPIDEQTGTWTVANPPGGGGAVVRGETTFPSVTHVQSTVHVRWTAGPFVGEAKYSPSAGFFNVRKVSVVKITLTQHPTNPKEGVGRIAYLKPPAHTAGVKVRALDPAGKGDAMYATLDADIQGPVVRGKVRGVNRLEIGFVQYIKFTDFKNQLRDPATTATSQTYSLHGKSFTDLNTFPGERSTAPWTNKTNAGLPKGTVSYWARSSEPTPTEKVNVNFVFGDTPHLAFANSNLDLVNDRLESAKMVAEFDLFFAVRSTDTGGTGDNLYFTRAMAFWTFNGSGFRTFGKLVGGGQKVGWALEDWAGTSGFEGFMEDFAHETISTEALARPVANDALNKATWTEQ